MDSFTKIPHQGRIVYKRSFMYEIVLFFTYSLTQSIEELHGAISKVVNTFGGTCEKIQNEGPDSFVQFKDANATVTLANNGVLVSLSATSYQNFEDTANVWKHVSLVLKAMNVTPLVWSFTKGNRYVFSVPVDNQNVNDVYQLILSKELLDETGEKNIFVCESENKTRAFTCRYNMEKFRAKDALNVKLMIVSQSYKVADLCDEVMAVNQLIYDCWHWSVNDGVRQLMNQDVKKQ